MQDMKGWERVLTLILASVLVILVLSVTLRIMEVNPMVVLKYALLIGYMALGVWLAVRQGRQRGMVRERIRNRPNAMFVWVVGLFFVLFFVTPW